MGTYNCERLLHSSKYRVRRRAGAVDARPRECREVPGRRVGIGRDLEKAPSPAAYVMGLPVFYRPVFSFLFLFCLLVLSG